MLLVWTFFTRLPCSIRLQLQSTLGVISVAELQSGHLFAIRPLQRAATFWSLLRVGRALLPCGFTCRSGDVTRITYTIVVAYSSWRECYMDYVHYSCGLLVVERMLLWLRALLLCLTRRRKGVTWIAYMHIYSCGLLVVEEMLQELRAL